MELAIRECYNQICLPKDRQNNIVLKHKLESIDEAGLFELRDRTFVKKVREHQLFTYDFSLYEKVMAESN